MKQLLISLHILSAGTAIAIVPLLFLATIKARFFARIAAASAATLIITGLILTAFSQKPISTVCLQIGSLLAAIVISYMLGQKQRNRLLVKEQ